MFAKLWDWFLKLLGFRKEESTITTPVEVDFEASFDVPPIIHEKGELV